MKLAWIGRTFAATVLITALAAAPSASAGAALPGEWVTKDGEALLALQASGTRVRVVLQAVAAAVPPQAGTAVPLDQRNPDEALRRRPLAGLELGVLEPDANRPQRWRGRLYDPASGETYSVVAAFAAADVLEVRGFVGLQMFGRSMYWLRLPYHRARVQALWAEAGAK